jgi:hypothetical protein
MMLPIKEHQEIPKGEAIMMPVAGIRKQRRVQKLAAECHGRGRKEPGEIMNPGGSRLPPAGRCPTMQKWHGERGNSSRDLDPRKTVDHERSSPLPE